MSQKPVEQPLSTHDRPDEPPAPGNTLPTYGDVSQGTALQPIVLPDGRTAYVPVRDSPAAHSPYGQTHYTAALDTTPEYATTPADLSHVLNYYNTRRPSPCCLLSSRAVILTLNSLAFIFSILSIAAPFAKGVPSRYCSPYYYYYYSYSCYEEYDFAFSSDSFLAVIGAIAMVTGFALYIPTLVLSAIFLHIGRQYPERERREAVNQTLSLADRRHRALTRIYYDVNITKALFATTLVSVCLCIAVTVLYFVGWERELYYADLLIGPPMPLVAAVLYLVALILTPIRDATNTSLEFPEEGSSISGGEGCCYFMCGQDCCS
ncbi:hypothetical protein, conserved [Angomonas deanei]|uniref:Uncharacterized protein n=1 Tax=Angomonas deanei TaxID=59799 RepID=A0A7G2C3W7_9TRYP|nr:hypothetical protein, conserved [Angomonas deanei]